MAPRQLKMNGGIPRSAGEPEIGQRLVAVRTDRGLSQGTVARRAGVDPSYLSRIERGNVQPTVRTAARLAAALRMSLSDLLKPLPSTSTGQPCPVTKGGHCLLDLVDTGHPDGDGKERYTARELRLIRSLTKILREGNSQTVRGLELLIGQMASPRSD